LRFTVSDLLRAIRKEKTKQSWKQLMDTPFDKQPIRRVTASPRWLAFLLLAVAGMLLAVYFQSTIVLILLIGSTFLVVAWRWPLVVMVGILAFMPLYDGAVRVATWQWQWSGTWLTVFSLWKEIAIALLFAVLIVQHVTGRQRLRFRWYAVDLWLLFLMLLFAGYIFVAARPGIGIFGLRNYLLPLSLFYLARLVPYSRRELTVVLGILTVVAVGVAIFGIYQAQFIDFAQMVKMGYRDETGGVPFAFRTALRDQFPRPRAVSTATGPNQLAVYLSVFILLLSYGIVRWRQPQRRLLLVSLLVILVACLLLTFSRGGFLAVAVAIVVWVAIIVYERGIKRTVGEIARNPLLLLSIAAVIALLAAGLIASGFATRVVRGLTGRDPAATAHQDSMTYTLDYVAQHPLGIGMGMVGERALQFATEADIQHTESTYLQVAMETGVFGMILLLITLASLLATLWRLRKKRHALGDPWGATLTEIALVLWIGVMVDFVVTPLLQNFMSVGYLWFVAGVAFHIDAYDP